MRLRLPSAIKAGLLQTSAHFWKITHGSVLVRATVQALWLNTACLWERASAREGVLRSWCTNYKVDVFCVTPHKTRRAYLKHACSAHLLIIQGFHHGYPQNFFQRGVGGARSTFCLSFQVADDAMQMDVHKTLHHGWREVF